jgi:DNA polymerase-3 subunit epsilon
MDALDEWIVLDTETTGLSDPVYPVEIAAQRLLGWKPEGEPFRMLVNFDVPVETEAEKLHGYSREYLTKHGGVPEIVLETFLSWAGIAPFVAYNLAYDWNLVLGPAYKKLGLECSLVPGFCALRLTKRIVPTLPNYRLDTVLRTFDIAEEQKHNALDDVAGLVSLLCDVIGPHMEKNNISGFDTVARCAEGSIALPPISIVKTHPFV